MSGKLVVIQGISFVVAAIVLTGEVLVYLLMGCSLVIVVITVAYSYFVWKGDSEIHAA